MTAYIRDSVQSTVIQQSQTHEGFEMEFLWDLLWWINGKQHKIPHVDYDTDHEQL